MVYIDDLASLVKAFVVTLFGVFGVFWSLFWDFHGGVLETFLHENWCGSHTCGPCASFLGDLAPPNSWKGVRIGGFHWTLSS
jgi:hypothetical protein